MANATLVDTNQVPTGTTTNPLYTSPANGAVVTLASVGRGVAVSITRTNDTNAYAANDVIGAATGATTAITFASIGAAAGGPG